MFQSLMASLLLFMHPFYISMTEIEQDAKANSLDISVRIFTDDFEKTIRQTYTGKVDLLSAKEKSNSEKLIQQYISKHLLIKADGKNLNLHFDGFDSQEGSTWSYFECDDLSSIKTLEITNTILYDYQQQEINFIHVKTTNYDETRKLDYPDNYQKFVLK